MVLDSTLQLTFRKLLLVEFWYGDKEEYIESSKKIIIKYFSFPIWEAKFSLYVSTELVYYNGLFQKALYFSHAAPSSAAPASTLRHSGEGQSERIWLSWVCGHQGCF